MTATGLEGVVAFHTEIAEPDRDGGALRYRGVDVETLVGHVPYEQVWGLLVDGAPRPGLTPGEPRALTHHSGNPRADLQAAIASLATRQLIDIAADEARDDLAFVSATTLSFTAQIARGQDQAPVAQATLDASDTASERFLTEWRGEADPDHVSALDAYWISAAEHGMNASTFTARIVAS